MRRREGCSRYERGDEQTADCPWKLILKRGEEKCERDCEIFTGGWSPSRCHPELVPFASEGFSFFLVVTLVAACPKTGYYIIFSLCVWRRRLSCPLCGVHAWRAFPRLRPSSRRRSLRASRPSLASFLFL